MSGPAAFTFRDAELRSLPLRVANRVGRGVEAFGLEVPSLDPESIVRAAQRRAKESDCGGDSFREPLERNLRAVRDEAELNLFGRLAVRGMLVSSLCNRFQLASWARTHPEVRQERIEAPWVIVGLPRTGTSLLSILLGLDPNARAPMHWEAARPVPPPTLATAAEDPRIAENAREIAMLLKLNPALGAMHPFGATLAQECVAFFMYDVRTLGVETQAFVPSYGRWLQGCDMAPAYAQHQLALQSLQAAQPTGRWVLKTPNHLWCLETLLATYPDARVIWTHRDPGKVITSLASLTNTLQRMFTHRRDPVPAAQEWRGKARFAMQSGMDFDARAPDGWCQHLRFEDLMKDPIGAVRAIFAHFDETPSPLHVRRMEVWLRERGRDSEGRHVYDPADFGWSYDELADETRAYRERFGVARE
jgi:hypothetical protein